MMLRYINGVGHLGGASTNVAAGIATCFGWPLEAAQRLRSAQLSAVVTDSIGTEIIAQAQAAGIDTSWVLPIASDGMGSAANVIYDLKPPVGDKLPAAAGYFYRAHSPVATRLPSLITWSELFTRISCRLLYADGIFVGLKRFAPAGTVDHAAFLAEGFETAQRLGITTAFDTNFRASLWGDAGGLAGAAQAYAALLGSVNVLTGSVGHFRALLGRPDTDARAFAQHCLEQPDSVTELLQATQARFPSLSTIGASIRQELSPSKHRWQTAVLAGGDVYFSKQYEMEIADRPGIGDAMTVQILAATLRPSPDWQVTAERAAANGWLMSQIHRDTSPFRLSEVDAVWKGTSAETRR